VRERESLIKSEVHRNTYRKYIERQTERESDRQTDRQMVTYRYGRADREREKDKQTDRNYQYALNSQHSLFSGHFQPAIYHNPH